MKQGDRFSDERVRQIKWALMRGTHPRAIARLEKCTLNTIIRMRDGDTYAGVQVEGEEMLRPALLVEDYDPTGPALVPHGPRALVPQISQQELDEMEARLLGVQAQVNAGHAPKRVAQPPSTQGLSEASLALLRATGVKPKE